MAGTWLSALGETPLLALSLERTIIYALFYAALFWLPVRGAAALLDHWRGRGEPFFDDGLAAAREEGRTYHIGMKVLPPF